jgi:site-specific DNA-methyltransferase (adenine-specific)/modification methylase
MKVEIGDATLYLGDCTEVLPTLSNVDVVITDPPYGLGELSGTTSKKRNKNAYASFDDTEENIVSSVIPAIVYALTLSNGRGLITPGCRCLQLYPKARAIGGFFQPAAVGMSPWGFAGLNPVLFYGKDPRDGKGQSNVMTTLTEKASTDEHPCAKPLGAMYWMVEKGSLPLHTVLDPFMGSGTTGVAAIQLGRSFIGIEREPKYFEIACKRIEQAVAQGKLFEPKPTKPIQETLI